MKTLVRLAVFLFLLSGPAYAGSNPYMPGGGSGSILDSLPDAQRQQILQGLLGQQDGGGDTAMTPAPQPEMTPVIPNNDFQSLRSQQADDIDAIARERSDRELEIKALKDAFDAQIHELQRKIDSQQEEIDNLRYKNP